MAQSILAIDSYSTPPQVYRLNPADPLDPGAKIGGPIPQGPVFSGEAHQLYASNMVIRHGSKIYANQGRNIYVYDELNPSADWQLFYTWLSNFWAGGAACAGLTKIIIDGEPHLCSIANGTASTLHQYFSWNLTTNTLRDEGTFTGLQVINTGFRAVNFYKEFIFYTGASANAVDSFNFVTNSRNAVTPPASGWASAVDSHQFVTWNGELYLWNVINGSNRWHLWRYDDTLDRFDDAWDSGFDSHTGGQTNVRSTLWPLNGYLYVLFGARHPAGGNNDGWVLLKLVQGTDITLHTDLTTSLPANLQMPGAPTYPVPGQAPDWNDTQRFTSIIDQSNPASPTVTLYFHETGDTPAGNFVAYSFNDPNMVALDSGTASNYFIPRDHDGGGDRFWTPSDNFPELTSVQILGATVRVNFRLHGSATNIRLYWEREHRVPVNLGSLTNPSAGTITGGNTMTGLTPNGTTIYSVEWRASFDGVANLEQVNFILNPL
ncbi:MAG: hypothetical protein ACYS8Y_10455 [Planctomycetota bacterium]|jgi:hypothetical protein